MPDIDRQQKIDQIVRDHSWGSIIAVHDIGNGYLMIEGDWKDIPDRSVSFFLFDLNREQPRLGRSTYSFDEGLVRLIAERHDEYGPNTQADRLFLRGIGAPTGREAAVPSNATEEERQFYADVLSTAVEGGIGYWCQIESWNKADTEDRTKVKVVGWTDEVPSESDGLDGTPELPIMVGLEDIERAFDLVCSGVEPDERNQVFGVHKSSVRDFVVARTILDAGHIDADLADSIFQIAAMERAVFG